MTDLGDISVGRTLAAARKKKRLRYKKLSSELNIDESYLVALEEDKFELIPGGEVYVKGFLRSYAKKLDLNPDEIIQIYSSAREKISDKLTLHASFIQSPEFKLGSNNTQTISTFSTSANSTLDQISVDLASLDLEKTEITVTNLRSFYIVACSW